MDSVKLLRHFTRPAALVAVILLGSLSALPSPRQTAPQPPQNANQAEARTPTPHSQTPADSSDADADNPPAGDWAPELLDGIISAQNPIAGEALYDAAFAVGPSLIPQLEAALKDDRTAEFAAQALAFLGGEKVEDILWTLVGDPRNLDLRRFYLGSLGEYPSSETEQILLKAVANTDVEPDRTVTEAAVWALTTRTDPGLPEALRSVEARIQDPVIRDQVESARQVVASRLKYLASPEGQRAGASLEQAVRTYFIGALQQPAPRDKSAGGSSAVPPSAKVELNRTVFSPDEARVLAHVTFEDPEARAHYDMVLQKQLGDWKVVSVWEGADTEEPEIAAPDSTKPAPSVPKRKSGTRPSTTLDPNSQPSH